MSDISVYLPLCADSTQTLILEILEPTDSAHRVTRKELVDVLHLRDRVVRDIINTMRTNGIPIASGSNQPGYYLPTSLFDYLDFAAEYKRRASKIFAAEKNMHRVAFEVFSGQTKIGDDADG